MDTVVILDCDKKWIANYKRMLASVPNPMDCRFFHNPEDAIQFMTDYPVAVLACEQDMPFMSGKEVFEMADILSPDTVNIVMTENKDVAKTLETLNSSRVFRLIVKPFFMVEDIEKPIREALQLYHTGKQEEDLYEKKKIQLESLRQRLQKLSSKLEEKKGRYASLSQAAEGIFDGNLSPGFTDFSQEESAFGLQVCGDLFKEFMRCYIFERHGYHYYAQTMAERFHHPEGGCLFQLANEINGEIPQGSMSGIGYGMFLLGYLCQQLLKGYRIAMALKEEDGAYMLKVQCQYPKEGDAFRIQSGNARQWMGHMAENLLKSLAEQMAGAVKEYGFAVRLRYKKEEIPSGYPCMSKGQDKKEEI